MIRLPQNSFYYGIYCCWFVSYNIKPCVAKHLLPVILGLGASHIHTEKHEKHVKMKMIYKLPILQPGVLAHSFNIVMGMQKLISYMGSRPAMVYIMSFKAAGIQLVRIESLRNYGISKLKWNLYTPPLT